MHYRQQEFFSKNTVIRLIIKNKTLLDYYGVFSTFAAKLKHFTMKISEILKSGKPSFSFEVFPPKAGMPIEPTLDAVAKIATLKPDFISVTYGAGGSNSKNTIEVAKAIQDLNQSTALAHLTCIASTKQQVVSQLNELKNAGIENILALRGDMPKDGTQTAMDYKHASDLILDIKKNGNFCIGAACYPECHQECEHQDKDLEFLKMKVDNGCDFLTTQMFFDNTVLYSFLYRMMAKNIDVPVIAGVMPVTNGKQIARSCALSGATLPNRFRRIADKYGDDPASMKQAGIAYATEQIIDLLANGVRGIHVYTMNKPDVAQQILNNISSILGR